MKNRLVGFSLLLLAVILSTGSASFVASAAVQTVDQSAEEAREYAQTVLLPGFIGIYPVCEDIDGGYILGDSYDLFSYRLDEDRQYDDRVPDGWLFFANDRDGNPAFGFRVCKSEGGGFWFIGPWDASGVYDAISSMKKLQADAGCPESFKLYSQGISGHILIGSFGQTERVISIPDPAQLDDSYYAVREYSELPTRRELDDAFAANREEIEKIAEENGGEAPYGGYVAVYPRSEKNEGAEPEPEIPGDATAADAYYMNPALAAETITNGEATVKSIYGTEDKPAENRQATVQTAALALNSPTETAGSAQSPAEKTWLIAVIAFDVLAIGSAIAVAVLHRKKKAAR